MYSLKCSLEERSVQNNDVILHGTNSTYKTSKTHFIFTEYYVHKTVFRFHSKYCKAYKTRYTGYFILNMNKLNYTFVGTNGNALYFFEVFETFSGIGSVKKSCVFTIDFSILVYM